ncbi:UNVERIFIED_ORG: hypothetical protein ABIB52_003407 [Arthrobacter sp. UYCu721]
MLPDRHQIQMVDPEGRLKAESDQGTEPGHGREACQVAAELCRADDDWIRWGTTTGWRTTCRTAER